MTWKIPWNEIVLMGNLERSAVGNKFGSRLSIGRNSLNVQCAYFNQTHYIIQFEVERTLFFSDSQSNLSGEGTHVHQTNKQLFIQTATYKVPFFHSFYSKQSYRILSRADR